MCRIDQGSRWPEELSRGTYLQHHLQHCAPALGAAPAPAAAPALAAAPGIAPALAPAHCAAPPAAPPARLLTPQKFFPLQPTSTPQVAVAVTVMTVVPLYCRRRKVSANMNQQY